MAHALQIDTLAFTKKLREAGAEEGLAEAIVEGLSAADTSELATKGDLTEVKAELKTEIGVVKTEIAEVKAEIIKVESKIARSITALDSKIDSSITALDSKIDKLDSGLKVEIAEVKFDILKWMFGAMIAQTGILIAVAKLFF